MFKQPVKEVLQRIPRFLAHCAGDIILGFVLFALSKWLITWSIDVIIVTLVLLVVAVPSVWKNPRCLPLSFRSALLGALSGKDTLIANGSINYEESIIYVDECRNLIIRDSEICCPPDKVVVRILGGQNQAIMSKVTVTAEGESMFPEWEW